MKGIREMRKYNDSHLPLRPTPLVAALSVPLRAMLPYRESNQGNNERRGPTLGFRFTEESIF